MEIIRRSMKTLVFSLIIIGFTSLANAQKPDDVLAVTRSVADKVVRETSFDYEWKINNYNAGISFINVPDFSSDNKDGIFYAYGKIAAEQEGDAFLGLSFAGELKVFINGKELIHEKSDSFYFREYTYNRFWFNKKKTVHLEKGTNEILLKFRNDQKNEGVIVFFPDQEDMKNADLSLIPFNADFPKSNWLLCGPFYSENSTVMEYKFAPEEGFKNPYQEKNRTISWYVQPPELVKELKISKENSYTRDSYADWHYANGETMLSIYSLYNLTGDKKYLNFLEKYTSNIFENTDHFKYQYNKQHIVRGNYHRLFRMTMLDDSGGPALPFAVMLKDNPDYPFRDLVFKSFNYVMNGQERLPDHTFCRPEPEPETIWADDLFMVVPFLLSMTEITGNEALYDEVCMQIIHFNKYLQNPETGLNFHGWYNQRKENSPVQWGRANGWFIWAVSEALLKVPETHKDYAEILKIYQSHIFALIKYQNENGMWNQVLDHPETYDETSCTAMFTLAVARGIRNRVD